jgi:hypothetical protein
MLAANATRVGAARAALDRVARLSSPKPRINASALDRLLTEVLEESSIKRPRFSIRNLADVAGIGLALRTEDGSYRLVKPGSNIVGLEIRGYPL